MHCLKCGRETENEQVFCDECLEAMKSYPVKPGTAIQLPKRAPQEEPKRKAHHRRALPPEEQVLVLRKAVRWLLATTAVCEIPFLANAFGFTPVGFVEYGIAMALAILVIPIVEVVKFFQRRAGK